jgi:thiamine pyrophosphokinase
MPRILIFANGILPNSESVRPLIRVDDFVIAADGGLKHVFALGLNPDVLIGDLDSVNEEEIKKAEKSGANILKYPRDKNETDLELAIEYAVKKNPPQIVIIGALGGRLDQTLANIALLTNPSLAQMDIRLNDGVEEIFFCNDQAQIHGRSGDIVSLIPWGQPVQVIRTENLKWNLLNETLRPERSRGISNELTSNNATIQIQNGWLLIIHSL